MTNTLYTTKTPTNQALTAGTRGNRITLPVLLPVLLVTLLVLSACGGGGGGNKNDATQDPANNCQTNPFGTACKSTEDEARRDAIIKRCIIGGNAGATASAECVTARREVPCIDNPFTAECASSSTFSAYVETARTERLSFCRMAANTATDFCGTAVVNICTGNIFDTVCGTSSVEERRDFCRMGDNLHRNPNCAAVAAPVCALNPLFEALCTPDIVRQRMHCRTGTNAADVPNCTAVVTGICTDNPFDGICAGTFLVDTEDQVAFCGRGNNSVTYESNCTSLFKDYCTTRAFIPACDSQTGIRIQACSGSIATLRAAGGQASDCVDYADRICGRGQLGGSNPFAPICTDSTVSNYAATINTVRDSFCANDVFNPLCDGYIDQRVAACHLNGVPTNADPRCPAIIAQQCPSNGGTRRATCHIVPTPLAEAKVTAPITNYVEATADELELGFTQSNVPTSISDFSKGTIQLSDLTAVTSPNGDADGVGFASFKDSTFFTLQELAAIARIGYVGTDKMGDTTTRIRRMRDGTTLTEIITVSNSVRTIKSRTVTLDGSTEYRTITETLDDNTEHSNIVFEPTQRFYAGVLDGDTLGAPLSENLKNAKWPAKLAIYNEVNLLCLGDENRVGGNPNCATAPNDGRVVEPAEFTLLVSFDGSTGTIRADGIPVIGDYEFAIDAGFNLQGKIFGNTRLSVVRRSAPGLFPVTLLTEASDGTITGKVGIKGLLAAFVSDGVNNRLGEYAGGLVAHNPHNGVSAPDCTAAGTPFHARCASNDDLRIMLCSTRHATAMADFAGNCTSDSDVTDAICAASGTYANPFDGVICADPQALVQQAFVDNCSNTNVSLRGVTCTAVTACITNPFEDDCNTGDTAEVYASARVTHLEYCNNAPIVSSSECELAVQNCASSSPHANCGDLTTTYCIGEAGRTITGDTSNCGARVIARCVTDPLSPLCADATINTGFVDDATLKTRREGFCRSPINANNPDCAVTIAVYCDNTNNATSNVLCLNRVHFRYNVIASVCHDPNRDTRLDNLCNNPHDYDIRRLEECQSQSTPFYFGCGIGLSMKRYTMIRNICSNDAGFIGTNPSDPICDHSSSSYREDSKKCGTSTSTGTDPFNPICEIDPRILNTVAALCGQGFKDGTIGTIGINPFSDLCENARLNPVPCPTCASISDATERATELENVRNAALEESQRNFCRQDIMRPACTQTIADFCPATPSADLFDDLCNGNAYLANRVLHCETGFTHAKCAADQMNISEAAAICGTTSVPGTDPFNTICKSETLNPIACPSCEAISDAKDKAAELARIRIIVLRATQQTFCRATANVGESICDDTISRFCSVPTDSDMIFDDLCGGADYTGARLAYCIHPTRSEHHDCETDSDNKAALMTLCGDADTAGTNPFSVACREAFSLRMQIDAVCGGGRNSQLPLCTDENAIPAIDIVSITASQQGFCRGNLANTACEETIADFCDFAFDTDVLDPLCGGDERYENSRLITCLNPDISHAECRGTAGIVATLCPITDGAQRHEDCPAIVDHAFYLTPVDEFDAAPGDDFVRPTNFNFSTVLADAQALVGVKDKAKASLTNVDRAIGFVTDSGANLIRGASIELDFGTLPANTVIRNGGDPIKVEVRVTQSFSNDIYRIDSTNYGYGLASAVITTRDSITNSYINGETKLYAGLLAYDGFGAPTFDNASTAVWSATMNLRAQSGYATASANFNLNINFISQRIRTHATRLAQFNYIGAFFSEPQFTTLTGRLTIDASFTRLGLIYGDINIQTGFLTPNGDFIGRNGGDVTGSAGTLVGRINDTQLIGAFASNAGEVGSLDAYAGGLLATQLTDGTTFFTAGETDKLTLAGKTDAVNATSLGITSNEDYYLTGSTTSGFALASVNVNDGSGGIERELYAGILTGTNLGNPLFDNAASGVWHAKLNLLMFGGMAAADFDLNIDFNAQTIKTFAERPAQFTFTDLELEVVQRSASNTQVVLLTNPGAMPSDPRVTLYLQDANNRDIDARVTASDVGSDVRIRNCATGAVLNVGDRIPLCEGGGNPIYKRNAAGVVEINTQTKNRLVETETVSPSGRLTVNGRFSSTGKISGTTNIQVGQNVPAPGRPGTLTGLIGENGLVATFISDAIVGVEGNELRDINGDLFIGSYAGGFTALAGVCTIGGTPFDKTACPDTNINARNLRLQLCIDRDPVAMPFATNCAADATITALVCTRTGTYANPLVAEICPDASPALKGNFINDCLLNPGHADACTTGTTGACVADPYDTACPADYIIARSNHETKCGEAETENRQDPTCANFRTFLAECAVATPNSGRCSALINTYCFADAGRTTGGTLTCANLISDTCDNNPFNRRCTDSGLRNVHAYAQERLERCSGDLTNLRNLSLAASVCNRPELSGAICGTPTTVGTNPFAAICSRSVGNPYYETAQLEVIQATFCRQSEKSDRNEKTTANLQNCNGLATPGTVKYWRLNAIHHVEVPVLNADGTIKTESNPSTRGDNPVTKIVRLPLNIIPANLVRQRNPLVNYIVGGVSELDLGGAPNPEPERDTQGNIIPSTVITNTPTSIEDRGGLTLFDLDNTKDTGSGFAFARATFATRSRQVKLPGGALEAVGQFDHIKLYTGLLADTDVGAPLSDIQAEVEWTGRLKLLQRGVGSIGDPSNESFAEYNPIDFTLLVSFYGTGGAIKNKDPIFLVEGAANSNRGTTFTIDGYFTDRGVIYGKTSIFSRTSNVSTNDSDGSLTGLIGADGAVAAFVGGANSKTANPWGTYAGGFVALPPATPSTAPRADFVTWLASFDAPNIPLTRAIRTEDFTSENDKQYFVQGTVSGLNRANENYANEKGGNPVTTLTFDTAFDDGNIYDGIAYLRGTHQRAYAGILSGTFLGAPVTGVADTTARWAGAYRDTFYATGESGAPFALTVGFTAEGGTLDGIVPRNYGTFRVGIDGAFDAKGIITGDVISGNIATSNCVTSGVLTVTEDCFTDDTSRKKATLTGLIGEQGAVAAFIGQRGSFPFINGWVGGFVALPPTPNYVTWRYDFATPLVTTPTTSTPANQFLQGTKTGLLTTGTQKSGGDTLAPTVTTITLADNDERVDTVNKLRGDAADGFAFFRGYIPSASTSYYYAGILSGTNLGAPLTGQPTSIIWRGHISLAGIAPLKKSFDLTVNLGAGGQTGGGTLSAFVPFGGSATTLFYKIDAEFDSNGRIITGDATNPNIVYDAFTDSDPNMPTTSSEKHTGILSGIIGEEGVVAAFISNPNTTNNHSFSGGLVAVPYFCVNNPSLNHCEVDNAEWINSFNPIPPADRTTSNDIFGGFLNLSNGTAKIGAVGLKTEASGSTDSASVSLTRPSDATDGVAYISGFKGANNQAFVGILHTTDLGAPLVEQPTAEWPGFYYDSTVPATAQTPVTFEIDFSTRSIGTTALTTTAGTTPAFALEFNNVGVVTGTVTKSSIAATARGLIGQEGLVGGFVDTSPASGNVFYGGFVADNPDTNN